MTVTRLPREPFLPHSENLVRFLWPEEAAGRGLSILEIGCGSRSPLAPILAKLCSNAFLYQIDARHEVLNAARQRNPSGRVEQMLATDMSPIPAESIDMVVAMAVFDQNPTSALPKMGREISRVLRRGGCFLYVHNEELNAPATSASFASKSPPACLLPSDRWRPDNDAEYCSTDPEQFLPALDELGSEGNVLQQYIDAFHHRRGQGKAEGGKRTVPFVRQLTASRMNELRQVVHCLRERGVAMSDHRTSELLESVIERCLLADQGMRIIKSGVFEIQKASPWRSVFRIRPDASCFVRGITKFGYATCERPAPSVFSRQDINDLPRTQQDDVLLISHQYGVLAGKK